MIFAKNTLTKKTLFLFSILFFLYSFSQNIEKFPLRKYKIAILSDSLKETSGLTFLKNKLYTFNDSGNPNEIYEIDKKSGKILKKIKTNFANNDWEAITNDGENLYIGDFGNNAGNRRNLVIYKLNLQSNINTQSTNNFSKISFNYSEQRDFTTNYLNHDYDAESMIYLRKNIHVFTKEWFSNSTSHYVIDPLKNTNQLVTRLETYKTGFVVTDVSYFQNKLYVVGYTKKAKVFLMIFEEDENGMFFNKTPQKYKLGSALTVGQIEGIAVNQDGIYISNESFSKFIFNPKQSLYFIPFQKISK